MRTSPTYEVVETDGREFMRDAARPFAVIAVMQSSRKHVLSRHATRALATKAAWRRRNTTQVR
jgi:hypothetical protein